MYVSSASYNAKFSLIVSGFISKNKASSSVSNEIVIIAEALSSVYSTFVVTVYTATFSTSSSAGSVTGSSSSSTTSSYSTKISLLVFSVKVTFLVTLPSTSLSPSRSRALY